MNPSELQTRLRGGGISDIQLVGFVDQGETPLRFRPMLQFVYFICGTLVLELETIRTTGRMQLNLVDRVRFGFDLDDGMLPATMSVGELLMVDPDGGNSMAAIHLWSADDSGTVLTCSAVRVDLTNGQQIFADPTYHFGIRLGGPSQEKIWKDNGRGAEAPVLAIGLHKPMTDRVTWPSG